MDKITLWVALRLGIKICSLDCLSPPEDYETRVVRQFFFSLGLNYFIIKIRFFPIHIITVYDYNKKIFKYFFNFKKKNISFQISSQSSICKSTPMPCLVQKMSNETFT